MIIMNVDVCSDLLRKGANREMRKVKKTKKICWPPARHLDLLSKELPRRCLGDIATAFSSCARITSVRPPALPAPACIYPSSQQGQKRQGTKGEDRRALPDLYTGAGAGHG